MSFLSRFFKKQSNHIDEEKLRSDLFQAVDEKTSELSETLTKKVEDTLSKSTNQLIVHEIRIGKAVQLVSGVTHECFDYVLQAVNTDIPVFLTGPAGCGKNYLCKQIAEALGLKFYFTNAVTQEYRLTGYKDANGIYHDTPFYNAFKYGGVFFLDEIDGSVPEALIILNAAVANRYFDFCGEMVEAHKDFRIIAAGNTYGTGGDLVYTGRYQLDAASLDRFLTIKMGYSPKIEKSITNHNQELLNFCYAFRKAAARTGINCLFSYRALTYITQLEEIISLKELLQSTIVRGLSKDDLTSLYSEIYKLTSSDNRYLKQISKLI